jgi:hypothetical protein
MTAAHQEEMPSAEFNLDSMSDQFASSSPENIRQWIVNLIGLTQRLVVWFIGVSLLLEVAGRLVIRLDTPPCSARHHPDSAVAII